MPTSKPIPETRSAFDFALAVAKSLLQFQVGVIRLAEVHDAYCQFQADLVENTASLPHEQIRQVLSETGSRSVAASESIWQAIETLQHKQPHRWEVSTNQERAAGGLLLAYSTLEAHTDAVARFLEESSSATDEELVDLPSRLRKPGDDTAWPLLDNIRSELLSTFRRICEIFAETGLREHLRISGAEAEQLAANVEIIFGDASKESIAGRPRQTRLLRAPCLELLRPLVKQILDSAQSNLLPESQGAITPAVVPVESEPMPTLVPLPSSRATASPDEIVPDDSGLQFVWVCPQCGRRVPRRLERCRCGWVQPPTRRTLAPPDDTTRESSRPLEIVPSHGRTGREAAWVVADAARRREEATQRRKDKLTEALSNRRRFFTRARTHHGRLVGGDYYRATLYIETGLALAIAHVTTWADVEWSWRVMAIQALAFLWIFHAAHTSFEGWLRSEEQEVVGGEGQAEGDEEEKSDL